MLFSTLSAISFTLSHALQLSAPPQVEINQPFFIEWSRSANDPSTFSLILKSTDKTETLSPILVDSKGASTGQTSFSFPAVGQYMCSAFALNDATVSAILDGSTPQPIASTNSITVVQSSSQSEVNSNSDSGATQGSSSTSFRPVSQSTPDKGKPSITPTAVSSSPPPPVISGSSSTPDTSSISSFRTLTDGSSVTMTSDMSEIVSISQSVTSTIVSSTPTTIASVTTSKGKLGILVGATVGPVVFLLFLLGGICFIRRRKGRESRVAPSKLILQHDAWAGPMVTSYTPIQGSYPEDPSSSQASFSLERVGAIRGPPISSPEKPSSSQPSSFPECVSPSPSELSVLSPLGSTMTTRQNELQSRINELIVRNTVLEAALAAANESYHTRGATASEIRIEIERLGQLLESDWALGLTDEPPPSYDLLLGERRDSHPIPQSERGLSPLRRADGT